MTLRPRARPAARLASAALLTAGALLASSGLLAPPAVAAPKAPAAPAAASTVSAASTRAAFTPAPPVWGDCSSSTLKKVKAECALLEVPLDYAKPGGTKIKLAISRIRHTTAKYQGAMLVNPGGPGGSGLGLAALKYYVPDGGGDTYDWIGFDPRGVGDSEPKVSCDNGYFGFDRPRYVPASPALRDAWLAKTYKYTAACAKNNGPILDHLTTVDSVNDMESIRRALGEKEISYYGFSYGTYLGQVYATLHPNRLRRVVFDGTVDPRKVWYQANLEQDVAFDGNINRWFAWISRHDDVYHLGTTQKAVASLFYRTQEKLYDDPATADGDRLGGSEWTDAFLYAGYYESTWTGLAETFSRFVRNDDTDGLRAAYLDANGTDDNGYAVYLGVQCTDTRSWPTTWSTWQRDNWKVFTEAPYETWSNAWYNEPCRHWPAEAHREVKIDGSKVKSLLMVNETLDAATPYAGSLEVRKRFPKARLIAEPGGTTHAGSLSGNDCVDDRISAYLATGKLPKRRSGKRADVSCAPLPQPDPTPADAKKAAKELATRVAKQSGSRSAAEDLGALRRAALPR